MKKQIFQKLILSLGVFAFIAPSLAEAHTKRCHYKKYYTRTKGTAIGAVTGAVVGSNLAAGGNKTNGAVLGAVLGGVAGSQIGHEVKKTKRNRCVYY